MAMKRKQGLLHRDVPNRPATPAEIAAFERPLSEEAKEMMGKPHKRKIVRIKIRPRKKMLALLSCGHVREIAFSNRLISVGREMVCRDCERRDGPQPEDGME